MKVSLCVPTFERPEMLAELLASFRAQDHPDTELCITDDSSSDTTEELFERLPDGNVRYSRNSSTLGFAANLRRALRMATGDIMVVLGDDDLLAADYALSNYARLFISHPDVHFAYSNLVQVDRSLRATLTYPYFKHDLVVGPGSRAIETLWLRSILISGMALRRSDLIESFYPGGNPLFPQVELVGRLLMTHSGAGLSGFLCATRAHALQLGFKAIAGDCVQGGEQHGNIEVLEIFDRLSDDYFGLRSSRQPIESQLKTAYLTNLPNEKILAGNRAMTRNLFSLVTRSRVARRSISLWIVYFASLILPRKVAHWVKEMVRKEVARRRFKAAAIDPDDPLQTLRPGFHRAVYGATKLPPARMDSKQCDP